ncbi:MAG: carbamoyltransferase [Bacteroidota bacterium]
MTILGISAFYHDSAAAIIRDGEIIAAVQEERFTRKKHDASFPKNAVRYCLEECATTIDELDAVVFYDKPLLKFERLLETYYAFSPRGIRSFIAAIPIWLKEKLFLKRLIRQELKEVMDYDRKTLKLLFPEHHLSHAASAFYPSAFAEAAILTIDGVGEWATASICHGKGREITVLKELGFPHSLGLLYSAFTYFLGFRVNSGEYKLMGLAPYGNAESDETKAFVKTIEEHLVSIKNDGSIWLDQSYFNYATGLRMVHDRKWAALFGFPKRETEAELEQKHCNLALAIQQVTESVVLKMAVEAKRLTGADHLCLAGGVALNCVANGKLQKANVFKEIFIQPAAGDAGGALGGALAAHHLYFEKDRNSVSSPDAMKGAYLGPSFYDGDCLRTFKKFNAVFEQVKPKGDLYDRVATLLAEGNIVGWMQGRIEFGPRALGNRSILGDARNPDMQKKLNLKIKYRESFRPFAPSVLAEEAKTYFELDHPSPYMLFVQSVNNSRCNLLPEGYAAFPVREKLYFERSDIPAVTHIDFSARIQTVHKATNPEYHGLLSAFKAQTGYSLLVNTSFNVRGEPIVCTPEDAYRCFMRTEMDYLVIGNFLLKKEQQPNWEEKDNWKEQFVLD